MSVATPFLEELVEPGRYTMEEAESLALGAMAEGHPVPEQLAQAFHGSTLPDSVRADRILELLWRITPAARLLPILDRIMPSSSARIRSKVWKIYAAVSMDLSWAMPQLDDENSRVAANVVEALWRAEPTEELHQIFRSAAQQERNRVAGNGLVGLFAFEDPLAVEIVKRMAGHSSPEFRATAAWTIGRVYWRPGVDLLRKLQKDPVERVRLNAISSLQRIAQRYPGMR